MPLRRFGVTIEATLDGAPFVARILGFYYLAERTEGSSNPTLVKILPGDSRDRSSPSGAG